MYHWTRRRDVAFASTGSVGSNFPSGNFPFRSPGGGSLSTRATPRPQKNSRGETGVSSNAESGCQPRSVKMRQRVLSVASRSHRVVPPPRSAPLPSRRKVIIQGRVKMRHWTQTPDTPGKSRSCRDPEASQVLLWQGVFVVKAKLERIRCLYGIANFNEHRVKIVPLDFQRRIAASRERGGTVRRRSGIRDRRHA